MDTINEQNHTGFVRSRTHNTCLIAEPVVVVIEGQEIELSMQDAKMLLKGLQEAVACVEQSETGLKGDGNYHLAVIGKTGSGMSVLKTKLGADGFIRDTDFYRQVSEVTPFELSKIKQDVENGDIAVSHRRY